MNDILAMGVYTCTGHTWVFFPPDIQFTLRYITLRYNVQVTDTRPLKTPDCFGKAYIFYGEVPRTKKATQDVIRICGRIIQ